jgi:DNA-binding response OmpR family regulator
MARVLILEDREEIRVLLRAIAERDGHEVLCAATAAEADALLEKHPALVFVDLGLPGRSGLDFARELRTHPDLHDVPIVVVTAHPDGAQQIADAGLEGVELISKPFRFRQVSGIMAKHLGPPGG